MHDDPIESLALWLHWMAHSSGRAPALAGLIQDAAREARDIHGTAAGDDDEPTEMAALVDRFAAKWEECERLSAGDVEPGEPRDLDPWGFTRGTQAARINELLNGEEFRAVNEVFVELVKEFPTATRARVNTHVQVLRQRSRASLLEHRHGRRVAFRLVTV
ncbi:MAG TPA: hypothetical protein VHR66_33150 [Gemmataceae bacterium]|jgi:hypothetical protein|nr:hypothetical protein [Gemmataceae bacterium]